MVRILVVRQKSLWLCLLVLFGMTTLLHGAIPADLSPGSIIIGKVVIGGNRLTHPRIILREMRFAEGDTLRITELPELLKSSRENIFNTGLFNFVTLDTLRNPAASMFLEVHIQVVERWYIWPWPYFEISDRNFNAWLETMDFSRLTYGVDVTFSNVRGRNETLKVPLHFGFNQQFGLQYTIPSLNRKQTLGISFGADYERNHEVIAATEYNKPVYFKDPAEFPRQKIYAFLELTLRPSFFARHYFRLAYNQYRFSDTLLQSYPNYSVDSVQNDLWYCGFQYLYKGDHRDVKFYPLKGYYLDLELDVNKGSGNEIFEAYLKGNIRKYWQLARRWYFSTGLTAKVTLTDDPPYFMQRGLGYGREYVRGYEYYVIDGRNFILIKNNLKFAILPQRVFQLGFLRSQKFNTIPYALYMNVLLDGGYVHHTIKEATNDLQNNLLIGYGIGLDFTTYYDIVIRAEFTMNGLNEPGLYLHFTAPL